MKALICDLDVGQRSELGLDSRYDVVLGREIIEAAHDCTGCFGCWTKTPGRCVMHDGLSDLGALLGAADELHLIARNTLGGYSPLVKRALDRSIPYLHPCFRVLGGEMHHRMRYDGRQRTGGAGAPLKQGVWLYGKACEDERAGFLDLVRANQLNQDCEVEGVWFCEDLATVGRPDEGTNAWHDGGERPERRLPTTLGTGPAGGKPEPPRRIALINASPKGHASATHALLTDFEEALLAYDRLSTRTAREDGGSAPAFVHAACRKVGEPAQAQAAELSTCDAVVVGFPLYVDALPAGLTALAERLAEGGLAAGTRVYAIGNLGFYEPEQLEGAFAILARACAAGSLVWCGALAVGGGGMVLATKDAPRMGMIRRARSEAIDRLVAAVRAGMDVRSAAEAFGATAAQAEAAARGVIHARCPLPRWAYRLAAESGWKSACRKAGVDIDAAPVWEGM